MKKYALLLVVICLLFSVPSLCENEHITLHHFSVEHGLSASTVFCIYQDSRGYMWFGTEDGLNRFDGYDFQVYRTRTDDKTSLSHNYIQVVYESPAAPEYLWVGTLEGLNRLDRRTEAFTRFFGRGAAPGHPVKSSISALYEAKGEPGVLWVGTAAGLVRLTYRENGKLNGEGKVATFLPDPTNASGPANNIRAVYPSPTEVGVLWLGTSSGLVRFDTAKKNFRVLLVDPAQPDSSANIIRTISSPPGNPVVLWVGTHGSGLKRFDTGSGQFVNFPFPRTGSINPDSHIITSIRSSTAEKDTVWAGGFGCGLLKYDSKGNLTGGYRHKNGDPTGLNSSDVSSVFEDRTGVLWIGTLGGGVNKYAGPEKFHHIKPAKKPGYGLVDGYVRAIFQDYAGNLWVGTNAGLSKRSAATGGYTHFSKEGGPGRLLDNHVNTLFESLADPGVLWIGTSGGLNRFDAEGNQWKQYRHFEGPNAGLCHNGVTAIYESPSQPGVLWIGTRGGLNTFDFNRDQWDLYKSKKNRSGLAGDEIHCIFEDSDGMLWFGTSGGLSRYHRKQEAWASYTYGTDIGKSLTHAKVWSVYSSSSKPGILWIGTSRGLNRLDIPSGAITSYGETEGLPNEMIFAILGQKDPGGGVRYLWLSTNNGLCKFDTETQSFANFDVRDNLQHSVFTPGAYHGNRKGEMYFGGINGLNSFMPDQIKDDPHPPQVVFTGFTRFNKAVPVGQSVDGRVLLPSSVNEGDEVILSYEDTVFSFHFSALHYKIPAKNQYAYRLEGFNKEWVRCGTRRFAEYTNLSPGTYLFRVKAANSDGVWSSGEKTIRIRITPPFWRTLWFQGIVVLLLIGFSYAFHRLRIRTIKARNEKLECLVRQRTKEISEHLEKIGKQKEVIETKNNQIMSSIRYAERIQSAILPESQRLQKLLPDHFVIFKPKDIVSGDFYWVNRVDDKMFVAVVDCTGHGVPGAFMSMIGNTLLNHIINENRISAPEHILECLDLGVRQALSQDAKETESNDGMDVCLLVLENTGEQRLKVTFCGAKRPLLMVKKEGDAHHLAEIKGTRQAVGGRKRGKTKPFTSHLLETGEGAMLYLTSDGYIDQQDAGDQRFGSKRLKQLLELVAPHPTKKQEDTLLAELQNHQGPEEQRDDITIFGIKV